MISEYTINQLQLGGVWNTWETVRFRPKLTDEKIEELDEVYIPQRGFEYVQGLEWANYKSIKATQETPWACKRAKVMDKNCIVIQEVDYDRILGCKVVTNDIDLIIWLEDMDFNPKNRIVNLDKKDFYDINNLERHGVRFNSTIDKEELDKNGVMITNIDHYDNYFYEIYDSRRNTFKHEKHINYIQADEETGKYLEDWLDKHPIKNDIIDIIEYWDDDLEKELVQNYVYRYENPWDKKTYGNKLYENMKKLCKKYTVPLGIGWDMWKILTKESIEKTLEIMDKRWDNI